MPKYQPRKRMTLPGTKGRSGPAVEMQNRVLSWEGKLVQKCESVGLKLESPRGLVCLFVLKDCPPGFLIQKVCGQFCNSAFVTGSQLLTVMMVVPGPCFQNCRSKTQLSDICSFDYWNMRKIFGRNQSDVIIWQIHKLLKGVSQSISGKLESHARTGKPKRNRNWHQMIRKLETKRNES